ncbi:MAG: polysaccharide biosynthesis/export family protein, partial [Alistipes sp.]|nr:polysaccharide biosynthesis/export family protein [Alistipes sp.]
MKRVFLLISALCALMISLQSHAQNLNQQALLEAYRNGTLSQGKIEELKKSQAGNSQDVNRTRRVTALYQDSTKQNIPIGLTMADDSLVVAQLTESRHMNRIFGHDLFTNSKLTFEPNLSIATPDNYVLGPGDEVIVEVWGDAQSTANFTISPDGRINIPNVGPVTLSGLSISEATRRVRNSLATIYEGLHDGSVKMKLSLGSIRSIQVNQTGEVGSSGTYTLPSLATLFHALHVAGGVNDLGTMRNIQVYRSGKLFSQVDVYDY